MFTRICFIVVFLVAVPVSVPAQGNYIYLGVSAPVGGSGAVDLSKISIFIRLHIDKSFPDPLNKFRPGEYHHGYLGLAFYGCGFVFKIRILRVIGGILFVDDLIQHVFRVDTPISLLNRSLWKYAFYRSMF
jgi:hypothetical protein